MGTHTKMAQHLRTQVLSHGQKVCRLYKKAIREMQAVTGNNLVPFRYNAVLIRAEFDRNKHLDPIAAKKAIDDGEKRVWEQQCMFPFKFHDSPGGSAHGREPPTPDWIQDAWHPLEKAQYPEYFARRDVWKREFIERYIKKYGDPRIKD